MVSKLNAAEIARLFLRWANIPIEIPKDMDALRRRRGKLGIADFDGPEMVFNVRNAVVHPPKRLSDVEWPSADELFETWQLATWYLELSILRVLDYRGEYRSRLRLTGWKNATEMVPWV